MQRGQKAEAGVAAGMGPGIGPIKAAVLAPVLTEVVTAQTEAGIRATEAPAGELTCVNTDVTSWYASCSA